MTETPHTAGSDVSARPATLAIVQARMSSTRFPGKVLKALQGRPMILFMLERVRRARHVDAIVLATSQDASDDALAHVVAEAGFTVHRGPLDDVLARFGGAAEASDAPVIIRLTGDCPLIDPAQIDRVIELLVREQLDYATNSLPQCLYPDGVDVEVFTRHALHQAVREARLPSEREHVTPYLRNHPELFKLGHLGCVADLSALRWSVDHPDDLVHVSALLDALVQSHGPDAPLPWL